MGQPLQPLKGSCHSICEAGGLCIWMSVVNNLRKVDQRNLFVLKSNRGQWQSYVKPELWWMILSFSWKLSETGISKIPSLRRRALHWGLSQGWTSQIQYLISIIISLQMCTNQSLSLPQSYQSLINLSFLSTLTRSFDWLVSFGGAIICF